MQTEQLDRETYRRWQAAEAAVMTPIDKVSDHKKYVIRSYLYTRSRLMVPGRNYDDNDHGPLSAGGGAHLDVIDFDMWLQEQDDDALIRETIDWMNDSSLELVAYWRGLRSRSTIKRRRDRIIKKSVEAQQNSDSEHRTI